jgi:DNA-binding transcriptional LysR family regulator
MIRELKTFLAVVRHGTFAGAGSRVGLTQSAVSAQMHKLEEVLGAPLFDRTGRSATLNAAGHEAVVLAEQIVGLFGEMGSRVANPVLRGVLRVGAIQTAQVGVLPDTLATLHAEHPQVAVRVVPGPSLYLLGMVDSGDLDAALMVQPTFEIPNELEWMPLLYEPFMLITPKAIALEHWREVLETCPMVRYDRTSFGGRVVEKFLKSQQIETHDTFEVQDIEAIVRMVSRGMGVSLIPVTHARSITRDVRVLPLGDHTFYREVGLVFRSEGSKLGLIRPFVECVARTVRTMRGAHPDLKKAVRS